MDQICEALMLESIQEMDEIDDEIYSESVFYLVDKYIDEYVEESMTNIFNSDSTNTVYQSLNDLINSPIKSDETDCENDSDFTYVDWAPNTKSEREEYSEEEFRDALGDFKYEKELRSEFGTYLRDDTCGITQDQSDYNNDYDSLFGDNQ